MRALHRPPSDPPAARRRRPAARAWLVLGVGLPLALGLIHVALIAPHYFVGSFDDDASYILAARALLGGQGLTGHLASGAVVAGIYPPGFPALLVPLVWLWPHSFVPLRLLSAACYAALFPLTWAYLGRRRLPEGVRVAALVVLALGPVLATYGSMVMAEAPYLVLLLVLLLLVERWEAERRLWTPAGVAVMVGAAALVWLKEAGIGAVAGLVLWLLLRRRPWQAAGVAGVTAALLAPVAVARLVAGVPLAGARYSAELGGYYHGGLLDRLVHVVPTSLHHELATALPNTLVPYGSPLPWLQAHPRLFADLSWHVTVLVAVGAAVWVARHRDAAVVVVPVYLAETLLWPFINERRVILVVPVLAAWYALGAWTLWRAVRRAVLTGVGRVAAVRRPARSRAVAWRGAQATLAAAAVVAVVLPLAVQLPRDYLEPYGADTARFPGARYSRILAAAGVPSDVVETDYQYSTALFTGHRTGWAAFIGTTQGPIGAGTGVCTDQAARAGIAQDHAGYLLVGDVNHFQVMDSPCLLGLAATQPWAVRLLRTARDHGSVFELVGAGTGHPGLADRVATATVGGSGGVRSLALAPNGQGDVPGVAEATPASGGEGSLTWVWSAPEAVSQVSVGEAWAGAAATGGPVTPGLGDRPAGAVTVALRLADGRWQDVARAAGPVGDPPAAAPFLLATLPPGTTATALRVTIVGRGLVAAADVHALGPGGP